MISHWRSIAAVPVCLLAQSLPAAETTTYTYDALGRLITSGNSGGPRSGTQHSQGYDPGGNRMQVDVTGSAFASGTRVVVLPLLGFYVMPIAVGSVDGPGPTESPVFSIAALPTSVNEGGVATFTVTKSGTATGDLSINYATVNGTATAPSDFTSLSGTLTFRHWESVKTISVETISDWAAEPAEQFSVALSSPPAGTTISTSSASVIINANIGQSPPLAVTDSMTVGVCDYVEKNVTANDTDIEGDYPLTVTAVGNTNRGTLVIVSPSTVGFSANGITGGFSVPYTVKDARGASSTGTINIMVNPGPGCL